MTHLCQRMQEDLRIQLFREWRAGVDRTGRRAARGPWTERIVIPMTSLPCWNPRLWGLEKSRQACPKPEAEPWLTVAVGIPVA